MTAQSSLQLKVMDTMVWPLLSSISSLPLFHCVGAGLLSTWVLHKKPLRGDIALVIESICLIGTFVAHYLRHDVGALVSLQYATSRIAYHLLTIAFATVAYRLSPLHPLYCFPGPIIHRITSLALLYVVYTGKRHLIIDGLHKKYGKFVRTGPNTLSINSHNAVSPIYASSQAWDKSDAYNPARTQGQGLFFIRDKIQHDARRRFWAKAFTPQALDLYKPYIENRTCQLENCIDERRDLRGVVDLGECIRHWSYDVMGDLTFGGSSRLELMRDGDPSGLVASGQLATVVFEVLGEAPSLFDVLWYLPISANIRRLELLAERLLVARDQDANAVPNDIASHLLGMHSKVPRMSFVDCRLDSLFAIQAGSDTTSGVLTLLFFLLIRNKTAYKFLQTELDEAFPHPDDLVGDRALAGLPYLSAVVNESLRLGTPFPGLPRVAPSMGAIIDDVHIPGGTIVGVPAFAQETSEENFSPDPFAFRPERWLPGGLGPGSKARKDAIMSFSFGAFGCLGRNLALQELRAVTAHLVLNFNMDFPPSFDQDAFTEGIMNMRSTIFTYPLRVEAKPRMRWHCSESLVI
ncbi:cytochrome P450 [Hygrophoropsis aurantiaca]|uniref:Cytochrome P450 n=1 Tax=Hygrophoropsis aurantiaca TaxID=72124 RepID=A0ACB8AMA5_9AGAM|nr:cytochrome P450 [Hygrophoropsis aurantiaca]